MANFYCEHCGQKFSNRRLNTFCSVPIFPKYNLYFDINTSLLYIIMSNFRRQHPRATTNAGIANNTDRSSHFTCRSCSQTFDTSDYCFRHEHNNPVCYLTIFGSSLPVAPSHLQAAADIGSGIPTETNHDTNHANKNSKIPSVINMNG